MDAVNFNLWKHEPDYSPELMSALATDPNYRGLTEISAKLFTLESALPAEDSGRKVLYRLRCEVNNARAILQDVVADIFAEEAMSSVDTKIERNHHIDTN